jgi:hypothetical protein
MLTASLKSLPSKGLSDYSRKSTNLFADPAFIPYSHETRFIPSQRASVIDCNPQLPARRIGSKGVTSMKQLITGFSLAAISAVVTTTAFAEGGQGIGRAGTYQMQTQAPVSASESPKTRAQVRAELAAAYSNGSLPALNRNAYPDRSMLGDAIAAQNDRHARDGAQAEAHNRAIVEYANGAVTTR